MSRYLFQTSYTPESWKAQIADHMNVMDRVKPLVDGCHGSIECLYYAFGDSDVVGIMDFPTPEDAAAFSLAVSAGGAVTSARTTPLLTVDQGLDAMHRAASVGSLYRPPLRT